METVNIEVITPERAREYLKFNVCNRRVNRPAVIKYKSELLAGNFVLNGESIVFCEDGALFDGQHRLIACVESGVSFKSVVVRGVKRETLHTIDSGKSRSVCDSFYISGIKNANNISALATKYFLFKNNMIGFTSAEGKSNTIRQKALKQALIDDYYNHQSLYVEIYNFSAKCYNKYRLLSTSEIGGLFMWLVRDKYYEYRFVQRFFSYLFLDDGNIPASIQQLKTKLLQNMGSHRKMTARMKSNLIAKTWNSYVDNKEYKVLRWKEEEGDIQFK